MHAYPMAKKPPPIPKLTNDEKSIKSIFLKARLSFVSIASDDHIETPGTNANL